MVDYFSGLVGPFPYPSLAHVQSSTIFGGMENATAIFYDEKAYATQRLGEGTVAHETAHQWFGDAVTEREWSHLWLSEGFATYFSALWRGHMYGDTAFQAGMQAAARTVRESPATERPIVDTADNLLRLLNSNNYQKGAWVLHSLRGVVGDSAFFRGIRDWYQTYRDSTALSEDFQAVMERASGRQLDWYFRQALHQPGYPVFSAGVEPAGPGRLLVTLRQVQDTSWWVFRLPGLMMRLDTTVVAMEVTDRETRRVIPWRGPPPASVLVDPRHWWLLDTTGGR
jgi:aminopeptidase N